MSIHVSSYIYIHMYIYIYINLIIIYTICCCRDALPVGQECHVCAVLTKKQLTLCSGGMWHLIAGPPLAYKEPRLLRICSYTSIAHNSNGKARSEGTHPHSKSSAKMRIAWVGRVVRGIHLAWDTKGKRQTTVGCTLPTLTLWNVMEVPKNVQNGNQHRWDGKAASTRARNGCMLWVTIYYSIWWFGPGWFRQYLCENTHMITATLPKTNVELQAGFSKLKPNTKSLSGNYIYMIIYMCVYVNITIYNNTKHINRYNHISYII